MKQGISEEAYGAGAAIGAAGIGHVELMGFGRCAGIRGQYGVAYDLEPLRQQNGLVCQEAGRRHVEQGEGCGRLRGGENLKFVHRAWGGEGGSPLSPPALG